MPSSQGSPEKQPKKIETKRSHISEQRYIDLFTIDKQKLGEGSRQSLNENTSNRYIFTEIDKQTGKNREVAGPTNDNREFQGVYPSHYFDSQGQLSRGGFRYSIDGNIVGTRDVPEPANERERNLNNPFESAPGSSNYKKQSDFDKAPGSGRLGGNLNNPFQSAPGAFFDYPRQNDFNSYEQTERTREVARPTSDNKNLHDLYLPNHFDNRDQVNRSRFRYSIDGNIVGHREVPGPADGQQSKHNENIGNITTKEDIEQEKDAIRKIMEKELSGGRVMSESSSVLASAAITLDRSASEVANLKRWKIQDYTGGLEENQAREHPEAPQSSEESPYSKIHAAAEKTVAILENHLKELQQKRNDIMYEKTNILHINSEYRLKGHYDTLKLEFKKINSWGEKRKHLIEYYRQQDWWKGYDQDKMQQIQKANAQVKTIDELIADTKQQLQWAKITAGTFGQPNV